MNNELEQVTVYISYSWAEASTIVADGIYKELSSRGFSVKMDKKDLSYKSDISTFMDELAAGEKVIVIINEEYLKSDNCMRELVNLKRKGRLAQRVYPIVIPGTSIYKPEDKLKIIRHWEKSAVDLEEALKEGSITGVESLMERVKLRNEIRGNLDAILDILVRLNSLSLKEHQDNNYQDLVNALQSKTGERDTASVSVQNTNTSPEILDSSSNFNHGFRILESGATEITESSVSFFSERMRRTFPGQRGLVWYDNPEEAVVKLSLLLQAPISFNSSKENNQYDEPNEWIVGDPIWWWRGGSSLYIDSFKKLTSTKVVIGVEECEINRIAAYRSNQDYIEFIYVETKPDSPTDLYSIDEEYIKEVAERLGYYSEEFAVFDDRLIKREEYDDGYALIDGAVTYVYGSELRVRYLTPYNFFIAAKFSGLNSSIFDRKSKPILDNIIRGRGKPEALFTMIKDLPKYNPNG